MGVGRMSGDAGALPECEVKTLMSCDHTAIFVSSSGWSRVGIGRSAAEVLCMGCHEKAPVRCPCSRLAALHGAPLMLLLLHVGSVGHLVVRPTGPDVSYRLIWFQCCTLRFHSLDNCWLLALLAISPVSQ